MLAGLYQHKEAGVEAHRFCVDNGDFALNHPRFFEAFYSVPYRRFRGADAVRDVVQ